MADSDKLWFELGVRDNISKVLNNILGKTEALKRAMMLADKDLGFGGATKNALELETAIAGVSGTIKKIQNQKMKLVDLDDLKTADKMERKFKQMLTALNKLKREINAKVKSEGVLAISDLDIKGLVRNLLNEKGFSLAMSQVNDFFKENERKQYAAAQAARDNAQANQSLISTYDKVASAGKRTNTVLDQIKAQLASTVSLYAMEGLLKSVIQVGGEFEVQHIALKSILGDIEQANTMFNEIKQLAVVSPFNFSQLISYSKQIAAFNIPYNEMYDTTKRLADMSAGLGIDMGRLILAYGQVRSAAVLRGQELRQFTEAGIPMVQALADEFTRLNGRVVTTGEVFELISKRAVPFEMVKKILWDMTDEGGRFFNMQFTLADTLAGKWSNLEDAWQIMLSGFAKGESLGGKVLKSLVQATTTLVESLDKLGPVLGGIFMTRLTRYAQNGAASLFGVDIERNIVKAQQLHAIELKRRYMNMEITREQYNQGMQLNKHRTTYYLLLAQEGRLKESQIARAIQQKRINTDRLQERVLSGEITMREAALLKIWKAKYAQANIFNLKMKEIGLSLKTMMGPFGWISLIFDGLVMAATTWWLKTEQATDKMNEAIGNFSNSARDRNREIQDSLKGYDAGSPTSDEEYRNAISAMKEQLKQYDANYDSIMREVEGVETLAEKYELLKNELEYVSDSYRLAGESKGDFETLYESTEGMNEASKSWATTNDYLNRSLNTLAAEGSKNVEKAIDDLAVKIPKLQEFLYDSDNNHRKTRDILRDYADSLSFNEISDLLRGLNGYTTGGFDNNAVKQYKSVFEHMDKTDKEKFEAYLKNAQERTLLFDKSIASEIDKVVNETYVRVAADLGEKVEKLKERVEKSGNDLDQKTKTLLRNYFSQQMSAITDGNQSLMRWVDSQRWTLYFHYDIVTDYTDKTGGLQGIAASAWSRLNPQTSSVPSRAIRAGFSEKDIKDAFGTSGNDVTNAKKVLSQRLNEQENLVNALKTSKDATEEQKKEAESTLRSMESDWNQMFTDNWRNLNSKGNPKAGSKKDVELEALKNRVDLYKKFYSELENASKIYGPGALGYLKANGFEEVFSWKGVSDLTNYRQTIDQLTKGFNANTEERKKWANAIDADQVIQKRKDEAEALKNYVSELQRMMAVMSDNYQIYKKWVELTGDTELAANVAGVTQNTTYSGWLTEQMNKALRKTDLTYSASDVFGMSETKARELGKDSELFKIWEEWQKYQQKIRKEQWDLYEEAYKGAKNYDDKIADINRKLREEIAAINELALSEKERNRLIENAQQNAANKISEQKWEKFKKENDWGRVFGDLDNMGLTTIKKMVVAMKKFQSETRLSEKETRAWQRAMKDLTDKSITLDPINGLTDSIKSYSEAVSKLKTAKEHQKYANMPGSIYDRDQADKNVQQAEDDLAEAFNNLKKAAVALAGSFQKLGSSFSSLGSSIGGQTGDVLSGFGSMISSLGNGIGAIKDINLNEKGLSGVMGKVSAVMTTITAMVDMNKALASILPSTESIYQKRAQEQKEINQLREAIDAYRVSVARARAEESGWISDDPLRGLQNAYEIHGEIATEYYNKLYEAQEAYVESAAGIKSALVPIVAAITAIVAIVASAVSFGTAGVGVVGLGAAAISALTASTVVVAGVTAAAIGAAIAAGVGYAVGQAIQAGIEAITYDNGQVDARSNMKVQTQHRTFFRGEKTQNLEEWTRENLGLELFDKSGLIDLKVAQAVLDSGVTLVGETKETLEKLMELREEYDEWEKSVKEYISGSFGKLTDNMTDAIWDWLANGENALDSFQDYASDTFKQIAQDAVKTFLKTAVLDTFEQQLEDLYKAYSMKTSDGKRVINEKELMLAVASVAGDMAAAFDAALPTAQALAETISNAFEYQGYDVVGGGSDKSSSSRSIQNITESTADLLAAYINAMRADVSANRAMIAQYYPLFLNAMSQTNIIANAQLERMRVIADNTSRNVQFVEDIYNLLHGVAPDGTKIHIA